MKNFVKKLQKLKKLNKRFMPLVAIEAVNFSKERFVHKNWVDKKTKPWKIRKNGQTSGSLMVDSGRLKRSIRKLKITQNSVTIGTDVPYAQIHNEGGQISKVANVKAHSRKRNGREHRVKTHTRNVNINIPKRQFLGNSQVLNNRIENMITKKIQKIVEN